MPAVRVVARLAVDTVSREGKQGNVREQVVRKNLPGRQRRERQNDRGCGHRDHVFEDCRCSHTQIFQRVRKSAATFIDPLQHNAKVGRSQDHVGRVARHVCRTFDGEPYIGQPQRGGVVDPVPEVAGHVARLAKGGDDAFLPSRVYLGKDVGAGNKARKGIGAQGGDLGFGHDTRVRHTDTRCDVGGDLAVFAGDDPN